jgi:hypothetical protein
LTRQQGGQQPALYHSWLALSALRVALPWSSPRRRLQPVPRQVRHAAWRVRGRTYTRHIGPDNPPACAFTDWATPFPSRRVESSRARLSTGGAAGLALAALDALRSAEAAVAADKAAAAGYTAVGLEEGWRAYADVLQARRAGGGKASIRAYQSDRRKLQARGRSCLPAAARTSCGRGGQARHVG